MTRLSLLLGSAALAIGTIGCAQCDTCDDFPAPCTGPNCGAGGLYGGAAGPVMYPASASAPVSSSPGLAPTPGAAGAPTPPPEMPPAAGDLPPAGAAPAAAPTAVPSTPAPCPRPAWVARTPPNLLKDDASTTR